MAVGIGIDAGRVGAAGETHLAGEPGDGLFDSGTEQRFAGRPPCRGEQADELAVVVEHLLEMRDQPARVGRVAGEATGNMVVDAALADVAECHQDDVAIAGVAGSEGGAPEEIEKACLRELGGAIGTAVDRVHERQETVRGLIEQGAVEADAGTAADLGEMLHQGRGVGGDGVRLGMVGAGDGAEHIDKTGSAITGGLGEVGAAPDWPSVGGEEHGERPTTALAGRMQSRHIDLVDVRTLFAVDLDVHEKLVHDRRGCGILETFMSHYMAPMAGCIADGEKDGLVGSLGFRERRRGPGTPMDRIVLVLEEIRTGFVAEKVFAHRSDLGW